MTYLFIFAHPDDETVSCSVTIKKLIEHGDKVIVALATDGAAGEVCAPARERFEKLGSVSALRRQELADVTQFLGVKDVRIFNFADGEITNKMVWNELKKAFMQLIDECLPDVVVTFDHSGWYFHLDHVGVSIAATLAFYEAAHRPEVLFHSFLQVQGTQRKWKYVFPEHVTITHEVDASALREMKLHALDLHSSQDLDSVKEKVKREKRHTEIFQLVYASVKGRRIFNNNPIFVKVSDQK